MAYTDKQKLIPTNVNYTSKDFSSIKSDLIEYTKSYFPDTYKDFNETSPGMMLIELSSYVGDDGYFKTTKTTVESIKNNIKLLLQTEQGERLFQPALGMNLRSVLFNQITEDSRIEIENNIVDTFNTWLPFVELRQIDVDTGRQDQNQIKINITFNIKRAPNSLDSVQVTFDGVGGGESTIQETGGAY